MAHRVFALLVRVPALTCTVVDPIATVVGIVHDSKFLSSVVKLVAKWNQELHTRGSSYHTLMRTPTEGPSALVLFCPQ